MIKTRPFAISPLWKLIVFLQALLVAWIGFTHGSGIEMYLQKFTAMPEKSILSWDRNIATLISIMALSTLWRPTRSILIILSLIYLGETTLVTLFGGFVDDRLPLLGNAVHFVLPLAPIALVGRRWALYLLQAALIATVGYYVWAFLNASPYYLDALIKLFFGLGSHISEIIAQGILLSAGILLLISLFWSSRHWAFLLVLGVFAFGLTLLHLLNFGLTLFPEACLKTELFACALVISTAERGRKRQRLSF